MSLWQGTVGGKIMAIKRKKNRFIVFPGDPVLARDCSDSWQLRVDFQNDLCSAENAAEINMPNKDLFGSHTEELFIKRKFTFSLELKISFEYFQMSKEQN